MDHKDTIVSDRPFHPSKSKLLKERVFIYASDDITQWTEGNRGFDVSDWNAILLVVHPKFPAMTTTPKQKWSLRITPARFRFEAAESSASPSGQWYFDEPVTAQLTSALGAGLYFTEGPMEFVFATRNCEKMDFMIIDDVATTYAAGGTEKCAYTIYGLVRKNEETEACACGLDVPTAVHAAAHNIVNVINDNMPAPLEITHFSGELVVDGQAVYIPMGAYNNLTISATLVGDGANDVVSFTIFAETVLNSGSYVDITRSFIDRFTGSMNNTSFENTGTVTYSLLIEGLELNVARILIIFVVTGVSGLCDFYTRQSI